MKQVVLNKALDFILPRFCTACQSKLSQNEKVLCRSCIENIEFVSSERIENEFIRKFFSDNVITDFVSSFLFIEGSVVQKLIHSLKYDQNFQAGNLISKLIYDRLSSRLKEWKADMIIPVPLHSLRRAERGYNQAKEISKGISRLAGIPCNSKILRREKYTRTQTKFTLSQRKKNISGAFSRHDYFLSMNFVFFNIVFTASISAILASAIFLGEPMILHSV